MDLVKLGKTNLLITKIGFGGIPLQRLSKDDAVSLIKYGLELYSLGNQIKLVHPLKFIACLCKKEMKQYMKNILSDPSKESIFFNSLEKRLDSFSILDTYIPDFANDLQVSTDDIAPFFQSKNWVGLIRFLINSESQ